jgi:hypothetical protein
MQTLEDVEKQIHDISRKLASETDKEERAELSERLSYLQHKRIDVSAREYAADVRDDYRFRQW